MPISAFDPYLPEGRVLSLRTLRNNPRRIISAGLGVVVAGAGLFLQFGSASSNVGSAQLAADRTVEETANRGGERSNPPGLGAIAPSDIALSALEETTTTVAPTTTTSTPPTTAKPRPTTTAAPRTTTTRAARAATPAAATPARETAPSGAIADDVWRRLAMCESGVRNDGGAPYYGYFQFSPQTWRGIGGPGMPNDHSYEVQKQYAIKLQARSGWGQWPVCGRKAVAG